MTERGQPDNVQKPDNADSPLEETVRVEREYVRARLQEELKRMPTEDEVDDWLCRHTEGY